VNFYCRDHPDFEGLDQGKLHEHIEQEHPELQTRQQLAEYFKQKIERSPFRKSDGTIILRTWGRPPKMGNWMGDNQKERVR